MAVLSTPKPAAAPEQTTLDSWLRRHVPADKCTAPPVTSLEQFSARAPLPERTAAPEPSVTEERDPYDPVSAMDMDKAEMKDAFSEALSATHRGLRYRHFRPDNKIEILCPNCAEPGTVSMEVLRAKPVLRCPGCNCQFHATDQGEQVLRPGTKRFP